MKIFRHMLAAAAVMAVAACSEADYKLYDVSQKDNVFFDYKNSQNVNDSVINYNFGYEIAQEHEVDIPVTLMGIPKDYDRPIDVMAVPDSTDMVEGTHYRIIRSTLRAGAIGDTVKILLLRDAPKLQEQSFRLRIAIRPNDELRTTGQSTFTITYSDIRRTERPKWWPSYSGSGLPPYSFENAQYFFKYFYDLAPKANKEIFDEIITSYGDYFVNFDRDYGGPITNYDAFISKYVLIPMYNDMKDQIEWPDVPVLH